MKPVLLFNKIEACAFYQHHKPTSERSNICKSTNMIHHPTSERSNIFIFMPMTIIYATSPRSKRYLVFFYKC